MIIETGLNISKLTFIVIFAEAGKNPLPNTNREKKIKYQHPKGAPDADLIFGSGPKKWVFGSINPAQCIYWIESISSDTKSLERGSRVILVKVTDVWFIRLAPHYTRSVLKTQWNRGATHIGYHYKEPDTGNHILKLFIRDDETATKCRPSFLCNFYTGSIKPINVRTCSVKYQLSIKSRWHDNSESVIRTSDNFPEYKNCHREARIQWFDLCTRIRLVEAIFTACLMCSVESVVVTWHDAAMLHCSFTKRWHGVIAAQGERSTLQDNYNQRS